MNLFETVKNNVSLREAAQAYGLEVNRHGKALCPFHNDRHPSLYVANDHYYCFTCGEHGDVIDFTARLFDLKPYDAAMKLVIDFHLDPDKPPSAAALNAKRIRTEAQKLKENERLCFSVLSDYYRSVSKAVVSAVNAYFDRSKQLADDPYLETREKEDAFLSRIEDTISRSLQSCTPVSLGGILQLMQSAQPAAALVSEETEEDISAALDFADGF